jgi:hypothetical protein
VDFKVMHGIQCTILKLAVFFKNKKQNCGTSRAAGWNLNGGCIVKAFTGHWLYLSLGI